MPHDLDSKPTAAPARPASPTPAQTSSATLATLKRTPGLDAQMAAVSPARHGEGGGSEGEGHGIGAMVEHGAHAMHRAHKYGEKAEAVRETLEPLVKFANQEHASRVMLQAHSQMATDLRLMKRGLAALERAAANRGGAKVLAKLSQARAAYQSALAEFALEKEGASKAGRFMAGYTKATSSAKGAALAKLGKAAAALEEALQGSKIGRGLLTTGKIVANPKFVNAIGAIGVALDGVAGYTNSTATTTTGKVANGALSAGSGALLMSVPVVAGADLLTPEGYKVSEVMKGGATAVTAIGEGMITGDTRAMQDFHEYSKAGQYGKVMQASSEAGDYWAEKGIAGGLSEFADAVKWWLSQ